MLPFKKFWIFIRSVNHGNFSLNSSYRLDPEVLFYPPLVETRWLCRLVTCSQAWGPWVPHGTLAMDGHLLHPLSFFDSILNAFSGATFRLPLASDVMNILIITQVGMCSWERRPRKMSPWILEQLMILQYHLVLLQGWRWYLIWLGAVVRKRKPGRIL